jgi:hypothetical protein
MANAARGEVTVVVDGVDRRFRLTADSYERFAEMRGGKDGYLLVQQAILAYSRVYARLLNSSSQGTSGINQMEMGIELLSALNDLGIGSADLTALLYLGLYASDDETAPTFENFKLDVESADLMEFAMMLAVLAQRNAPPARAQEADAAHPPARRGRRQGG